MSKKSATNTSRGNGAAGAMRKEERPAHGGKRNDGNGSSPLSQIKDFYKFMVDQSLETLEYDHGDLHVRMVRRKAGIQQVPVPIMISGTPGMAPIPAAGIAAGTGREENGPRPAASAGRSLPPNGTTVKAPMMGIFYRASTPSSPPFVKNGELVRKGQVLCLIEAMKVFNEVKADFDCMIVDNLLDNGKPVKVGTDLFVVERK